MNNQTKTYLLGAIGLVVVIGLVWWGSNQRQTEGEQETIKIGGAFSLTGFAAQWGEADYNGALLAVEEINASGGVNGQPIELVIEDITTEDSRVISAVQKLISVDGVQVLIGPTWLDSFTGAAPLASQAEVVMISPSASITAVKSDQNYDYVFTTWFRSDKETRELVQYLVANGKSELVLMFANDPFWQDTVRIIKEEAPSAGATIVQDYAINSNDLDFRTPLSRVKGLTPDAIIFGFDNESQLAAFLRQRAEVYPDSEAVTTEYIEEFAAKPDYQPLLTNVIFVAPKLLETDFVQRYRERFGKEPVFSASNSYDATKMVLRAMAAGNVTGPEINEFLKSNTFETTTFGRTNFDDIGGVEGSEFVIKRIEKDVVDTIHEL